MVATGGSKVAAARAAINHTHLQLVERVTGSLIGLATPGSASLGARIAVSHARRLQLNAMRKLGAKKAVGSARLFLWLRPANIKNDPLEWLKEPLMDKLRSIEADFERAHASDFGKFEGKKFTISARCDDTNLPLIKMWADTAKRYATGNCQEFAAVAFMYLFHEGIRPIDFMGYDYLEEGKTSSENHGFVVIGSRVCPRLDNLDKWLEESIICDPYHKEWGNEGVRVKDILKKLRDGKIKTKEETRPRALTLCRIE